MCTINLRTDLATGASTGGTWSYLGYSTTVGGTPGAGGTTPPALVGDNPAVDFSGYTPGFYHLRYAGGSGDCASQADYIVPVVDSGDAGTDATIDLCEDDAAINISAQLGGTYPSGINPPDIAISGDTANAGYSDNSTAGDVTDDTFDPSLSGVGTFTFTITVTPEAPAGYTLAACTNCDPSTATLTINVLANFNSGTPNNVAVCN
jgi:hypothetical protein